MALPGGRLIRFARRASEHAGPSASEIVAALPVPTLLLDPRGDVADVNAAAEALLNTGRSAIIGKPLTAHLALPVSLERDAPLTAYDVVLTNERGLNLPADLLLSPLPERPGWRLLALHPVAASHPIGSRRAGGSGARAAIGAAAMLAHEIKNPLSGISGAAQLLERKIDCEHAALTGLIRAEAERIAALIDRMQDFTDSRPLPLTSANIYPVLDRSHTLARHGFAQGIAIKARYDPSLPPALIDEDALMQVMLNLLTNAAEALDGVGTPTIRIATAFRHGVSASHGEERRALPIELTVSDNGPGPPSDLADDMFAPFVSSKRSGRGLGLALVDKLVRDMGGLVQFARENERTVFRVLLRRGDG